MIYTTENTSSLGKPVKVFLDGKELKYATYADTDKGIVRHYDDPPKLNATGEEIQEYEKHGLVTVGADK